MIYVFVQFFAVVARLQRRNLLVSRFTEDVNTKQHFFSFSEIRNSPLELKILKKSLTFDKLNEMG